MNLGFDNTDAKRILFSVSMSYSITLYIMDFKQNTSFIKELYFLANSMTKVNMSSDLSNLYYLIPTIVLIISINTLALILFKSLETNFVYKMIIFDSINNILFAIVGSYGNMFKKPLPFAPFCSLHVAFHYGLATFNRVSPLAIVLYR